MPRYFTPEVFTFLRELEANNHKEWWDANKERYALTIREPALDFIEVFGEMLEVLSPHFRADTRTNGGSLTRPYRDMRFVTDGAPYKTTVGIQFRHEQGRDVHAPSFYLHVEPGQCFAGVGLWHPETKVARAIRQSIYENPDRWKAAAHTKSFTATWKLADHDEDRLKKVPSEFEEGHPFPDDLRLKSFTAGTRLTHKEVTSAGFPRDLLGMFKTAKGYTRFLCEAIGVPF